MSTVRPAISTRTVEWPRKCRFGRATAASIGRARGHFPDRVLWRSPNGDPASCRGRLGRPRAGRSGQGGQPPGRGRPGDELGQLLDGEVVGLAAAVQQVHPAGDDGLARSSGVLTPPAMLVRPKLAAVRAIMPITISARSVSSRGRAR